MKKTYTLMRARQRDRRHLLRGAVAAAGAAVLSGCDRLSQNEAFVATLKSAQTLSHAAARVVAPQSAMAQEFGEADIAPTMRANGTLDPADADYVALRNAAFAGYRVAVGGRHRTCSCVNTNLFYAGQQIPNMLYLALPSTWRRS